MVQLFGQLALVSDYFAALGWVLMGTFINTTLEVLALRLIVVLLSILPILLASRSFRAQCLALAQTTGRLGQSTYYLNLWLCRKQGHG